MWSWIPVPRRLLSDDRILNLALEDRAVFLSLYLCADEHGRFDAGEMALRRNAGVVTGVAMLPVVERLADLRLVHLYERNGSRFGLIDHFDEDITQDHTKKRPRPSHPAPATEIWKAAACSGMYRGGQDQPFEEHRSDADRSVTEHGSDADRLKREKKEREVIPRGSEEERAERDGLIAAAQERARARVSKEGDQISRERDENLKPPMKARSMEDQLSVVREGSRQAAQAWLVEMAKVRRRHGGALWSECRAEMIVNEFVRRLAEIADVGDEPFVRGVEIMIERGKGFGRGMPGEGLNYLEKIVRNWSAEQDNEKTAETKKKRRRRIGIDKGDGFRRLGPAPKPGEVDKDVDDSLSDVMEG